MLKLNKLVYVIVGLAALLVAFASLGVARTRQAGEIEQLERELNVVKVRVDKLQEQPLIAQKADLELRIQRSQAALDAAKTGLRKDLNDIETSESLFQLARQTNVRISGLIFPGFGNHTVQAVSVSTLPLSVTINGDIPSILQFTKGLGVYSTAAYKNVIFTAQKAGFSATIQFDIYSYQGK